MTRYGAVLLTLAILLSSAISIHEFVADEAYFLTLHFKKNKERERKSHSKYFTWDSSPIMYL